jgi:hypothetical protein
MEPVSTTALIGAGISALSAGGTAAATGAQNRKSRAFSREMYQQQKQDNIQFWNMQNEYNSPTAQMARLKGAGLNPNMLYDKTGAVIPAQNINTPDVQSAQFRTPDFGSVGSGLVQGYFDTKIKQAQYDNLKVANTVSQQEAILKAAQAAGEVKRTEGQGISNTLASSNLDAMIRRAGLENQKLLADTQFTLNSDQRAAISNTQSVAESVQRVKNMATQNINDAATLRIINQQFKNLVKDGTLKQLDINLKKDGVQPTDALWQRVIAQLISNIMPTGGLSSIGSSISDWAKGKFNDWNKNYPGGSW